MTAANSFPTYSIAHHSISAFVRSDPGSGIGTVFSGPTPFEIPKMATLDLDDADQLVINFDYSDHEQAEDSDRLATLAGNVIARLGRRSKKILRLQFSGDLERHLLNGLSFDDAMLESSGAEMQRRSAESFRRNAVIIREILKEIPDDILRSLLAASEGRSRIEGQIPPLRSMPLGLIRLG